MISRKLELSLLILLLCLSLFLRLHALDVFLSGDEAKWICRGINFHAALARGDLRGTYQSEHPGVVTMWISTLAVPLSQAGEWVDLCAQTGGSKLTRVEDHAALARLPSLIFRARRLLAIVTWLGIVGMWWLCRRLFDERTALLAVLFIGLDPFYLALSRVLHLDALLATFMALSVLSLILYVRGGHRRRDLALSAVTGGLAMANKSPGLFLIPWTGLLLPVFAWLNPEGQRRERVCGALKTAVLWGTVALGVVLLLWPTLWVDPLSALGQVFGAAVGYAEEPHGHSNFFWGHIRPDPGPAFYPVAWAFRTTPWAMLGLPLILFKWRGQKKRPVFLMLGGFALLYAAFMTLGAKKFDRYLLPIFPFVDLLAAAGWAHLVNQSTQHATRNTQHTRNAKLETLLTLVLLVAQFAALWSSQPYAFSYYNPLLGGAGVAQRVLLVGWGEGMERAAYYLNQKPDAEQFHVNTAHISQFAPFFEGHTSSASDLDLAESDYYVFYINTIQRLREPEVLLRFYGRVEPEKVVRAHGIGYVWIYPNILYRPALDYIEAHADPEDSVILLDVDSALARHYDGPLKVAVVEGSILEDDIIRGLAQATEGRSQVWYLNFPKTPGDARGLVHRHLEAQADLEERAYFEGMIVERYDLHSDAQFVIPTPTVQREIRLGDQIRFLGYDLPNPELSSEQPLEVTLYWRATASVDTSYTVFTHLLGPDGKLWGQLDQIPQDGTRPTDIWLPGETIVDHYKIPLKPGAPAGDYTLALGLYDLQTMNRLPPVDASGRWLPKNRILIEGLSLQPSGR
ncbi:MAG: glycosyltransferase family 39 protein [Chloroflexota bacterium]|nr:glycosyltransferase family 39 protein [Chloroflexota bacterium]